MIEDAHKLSQIFCASYADFALYWRVDKATVSRWAKRNPDFCNAIERGRQSAKIGLQTKLVKLAKEGNLKALIFVLTNKFSEDWSDRRAVVNNKVVSGQVNITGNRKASDVRRMVKNWSPKEKRKYLQVITQIDEDEQEDEDS